MRGYRCTDDECLTAYGFLRAYQQGDGEQRAFINLDEPPRDTRSRWITSNSITTQILTKRTTLYVGINCFNQQASVRCYEGVTGVSGIPWVFVRETCARRGVVKIHNEGFDR